MLAMVGGTALHLLWCYLLVAKYDLGVEGLALATSFTYLLMFLMITEYAHCLSRLKEALFCPDKSVFEGWGEYFKLGIPAMIMICAEDWAFQILTFLAGILGVGY